MKKNHLYIFIIASLLFVWNCGSKGPLSGNGHSSKNERASVSPVLIFPNSPENFPAKLLKTQAVVPEYILSILDTISIKINVTAQSWDTTVSVSVDNSLKEIVVGNVLLGAASVTFSGSDGAGKIIYSGTQNITIIAGDANPASISVAASAAPNIDQIIPATFVTLASSYTPESPNAKNGTRDSDNFYLELEGLVDNSEGAIHAAATDTTLYYYQSIVVEIKTGSILTVEITTLIADPNQSTNYVDTVISLGGLLGSPGYELAIQYLADSLNDPSIFFATFTANYSSAFSSSNIVSTPGDDSYEPNNSKTKAAALVPGVHKLVLAKKDHDWFTVLVNIGDTLDLKLEFNGTKGNIDIEVATGSFTLDSSLGTNTTTLATETITLPITEIGTHYIHIFDADSLSQDTLSYELQILLDTLVTIDTSSDKGNITVEIR